MLSVLSPCRPSRLPERFDFAPIDTCEEAMFAPGADMLVRALVGDTAARVTFSALGHKLEYTQDAAAVNGTIDGQAFSLMKTGGSTAGETSGGPIDVRVDTHDRISNVEGHAGKMGFKHELERREPPPPGSGSARLALITGKFD